MSSRFIIESQSVSPELLLAAAAKVEEAKKRLKEEQERLAAARAAQAAAGSVNVTPPQIISLDIQVKIAEKQLEIFNNLERLKELRFELLDNNNKTKAIEVSGAITVLHNNENILKNLQTELQKLQAPEQLQAKERTVTGRAGIFLSSILRNFQVSRPITSKVIKNVVSFLALITLWHYANLATRSDRSGALHPNNDLIKYIHSHSDYKVLGHNDKAIIEELLSKTSYDGPSSIHGFSLVFRHLVFNKFNGVFNAEEFKTELVRLITEFDVGILNSPEYKTFLSLFDDSGGTISVGALVKLGKAVTDALH